MTRMSTCVVSIAAMGAIFAGCAGQLTDAEKDMLVRDIEGGITGGAGGAGPTGGTGGTDPAGGTGGSTGGTGGATGGAAGAGGATGGAGGTGMLDPCMAPLMMSKCSSVGCHGGSILSAGLDLSAAVIAAPQMLVDRNNKGETGGCMASAGKIIDSQRPDQSLLYTKVTAATCGVTMPPTGKLAATEAACVLNWIRSIPGVNGGTGGTGGAGGAGGSAGAADAGRDAPRG